MVQLLIECGEGDENSELCRATDAWRRRVLPTATHFEATPRPETAGWLVTLERAGSAGELQNLLDTALNSTDPRPPFKVDEAYPSDNQIHLKVSGNPPTIRVIV